MKKLILVVIAMLLTFPAFAGDSGGVTRPTEQVVNDIWDDTNNCIRVSQDVGNSLVSGQRTTFAIAGIALTADTYYTKSVTVCILPTNTGNVYIGSNNTLTNDNGVILTKDAAGVAQITIEVDNPSDIFVTTQRTGEGVGWVGVKR